MPIGPSTTTAPFLVASEPNVRFVSVATSGDALPGGGVFGGIPDGIGAYDNGDGTFTALVNHEITVGIGIAHGPLISGAYIDRLIIDKASLAVVGSANLVSTVHLWNDATDSYFTGSTAFSRFCSADLPATSALFNAATGLGTSARLYFTGEESGPEGRATVTIATGANAGNLYELPALGNLSYENIVANPYAQDKTIIALDDDGLNGQVYIYVGQKQAGGSEIEQAGLTHGRFYGIKVTGILDETNGAPANGAFTLAQVGPGGDVSNMTGAQIDAASELAGVTSFLRPEDFSWDPQHPDTGYFTTTNSFTGNTRVYQLKFTDITNPQLGGTVTAVIDGTEGLGAHMFDNLTVANGHIILNEDPGDQSYVARVWDYDIAADHLSQVASFNPTQFTPGAAQFITQDEESSGVLDVTSILGDADTRAYLLDAQVHSATGNPATVEQGQLMVMYVDDPFLIGANGDDNLFGSAANETLRGNNGNDSARAGSGNDLVYGGNGNDRLYGGAGNDQLFGDNGDDVLAGGTGNDALTGGRGDDLFVFDNASGTGVDHVLDFSRSDRLLFTVQLADPDQDGVITLGANGILALQAGSTIEIDAAGGPASALHLLGTETVDGVSYYSYGIGNEHGSHFESLGAHGNAYLV